MVSSFIGHTEWKFCLRMPWKRIDTVGMCTNRASAFECQIQPACDSFQHPSQNVVCARVCVYVCVCVCGVCALV